MSTRLVTGAILLLLSGVASAIPVAITSYDIANTHVSGTGLWAHAYSGTITPVSGSIANYTGGSGTLNDGVVGTSASDTQLFNYPSSPGTVITLHLGGLYSINSILLQGGNYLGNSIPGTLYGLDVGINSVTQGFTTIAQGFAVSAGLADDFVSLAGSSLAGLVTDTIILSGFDSTWGTNTFSITEIVIDGARPVAVPEPAMLGLIGFGLLGVGLVRRRRRN